MKNIINLLVSILFLASYLHGQVPRLISYQGILTDNNGKFISNGKHAITLRLYDGLSSTSPIYTESHTVNINNGLFNVLIGSVTPISMNIPFDRAYFLGVSVDLGAELTPRTPFAASAYAFRSEIANKAESLMPGASGLVTSLNNIQGNVTLVGTGGTTVSQAGSIITINSTANSGGTAGGDLSGTYPNPSIGNSKVNSNHILDGTIQAMDLKPGLLPSNASGDVTGPYTSALTVTGIRGRSISTIAPLTNQVLKYNGTTWLPSVDQGAFPVIQTFNIPVVLDLINSGGNVLKANSTTAPAIIVNSTSANAIVATSSSSTFPVIHSTANGNIAAIYGKAFNGTNSTGIYGDGSNNGFAGFFRGNVTITGAMIAQAKNFRIDHPLDPENKTLTYTSIESPDMMNIYNGNIVLDIEGEALVELPDYFEALNTDFKYQLTWVGSFSQVFIKEKVKNNKFLISGGVEGQEISWQISGVRKDPYAVKFKLPVEALKRDDQKGLFISPEAYGKDQNSYMFKSMLPAEPNYEKKD